TGVAYGVFQGRTTIFVAQVYGNPLVATQAQPQAVVQEGTTTMPRETQSTTEEGETQVAVTEEETTVAILGAETETVKWIPQNNEPKKIAQNDIAQNSEPEIITQNEAPKNNEPEKEIIIIGTAVPTPNPTNWQKALASPRHTMNLILFAMLGIILMALLLNAFIKIRNHHFDLVTNGLTAMAIIGAIFVGNYYESHRNMIVTQSMDYANEIAY
ncbi:MAG: hypothetical protein WD988_05020, partial [Candidatus Curtissbacteria bacterium]